MKYIKALSINRRVPIFFSQKLHNNNNFQKLLNNNNFFFVSSLKIFNINFIRYIFDSLKKMECVGLC